MEGADLRNIKGIGDKMSKKILHELGGAEELNQMVENLDLEKLIAIEGISQRKAVEIMNQLIGNPAQQFLKSERAYQLYDEIVEKILKYSNTSYSKNRILLLAPIKDEFAIAERLSFVMQAKEKVSQLNIKELSRLMKKLDEIKTPKANYDASKAILVESAEDASYLMDLGLNNYYTIITASDSPLFIEEILDYFRENRALFETVAKIREILGEDTVLGDVGTVLDELDNYKQKEIDLDEIVTNEKANIDHELKERIENIDLKGDEILELLNNDFPPKIEQIFDEILTKSKEIIKEKSGISFDPFIKKYPIEIDDMEMERIKMEVLSKAENNYFDKKISAAEHLEAIRARAEDEVMETVRFDFEFALGSFAYYYNLNLPEFGDVFELEGALHLDLCLNERKQLERMEKLSDNMDDACNKTDSENELYKEEKIQRVNYKLSKEENVALLTGANSGGKTTLLETISQISIMAQMGLPVPAESAKIKLVDEIYHFSKKRSLDAGAFESFLNVFMPIVTSKSEKLVLLDELEGITELEAAVKIISSFIEMIQETDSYAIIVTHMANELMKFADVRVDGIEATGLDENYNLIVDRTPRMNYLAKSTPELILKRMYENSSPELKVVYKRILEKF